MLPKIPYRMEKNKSQSIPMRSINLGPSAEAGELSDSLGISTRKFPYLTVRRGDSKLDGYKGVRAMTVFDGEAVTIREGGIYFGEEMVGASGTDERKKMASINTKLVVYPDKLYYDGQDHVVHGLETGFTAPKGVAVFGKNFLKASSDKSIESGYGGRFLNNSGTFSVNINKKIGFHYDDLYFVSDKGYIARAAELGELVDIEARNDDPDHFFSATCKITSHTYTEFKLTYQDGLYPIIAAFDENNEFLGFFKEYTFDFPELGYEDFDDLTQRYTVRITQAYFENGNAENIAHLYRIDFPYENVTGAKSFNQILGDLTLRYVSINDENGECIIRGNIKEIGDDRITFDYPFVISPNSIHFGNINARAYGWSAVALTDGIASGDEIFFPNSNLNTGHYTVKSVSQDEIFFEDDEVLTDEFFSDGTRITIEHWNENLDNISNLKVGDAVEISGCSIPENNTTFVISEIKGDTLYADADIFTEGVSTSDMTISRKIPDLDFICEKDNRLYGVNSSEKTIYVSALGDPTNMYTYEGVSTDSFAVAVGGEGDFTACCKYGEAVLFFKEDMLYKLTGSYPAEFALYSYNVAGVEAGSEKSCVVINEVLYYKGRQGVYAYTGGIPVLISECFGERRFSEGVGGTDGRYYYLSVIDEEKRPYLFTYDTRTQLWLIEEKVRCVDFARTRDGLYYAGEDGCVYAVGAGQPSGEWLARWAPIYELIDGKRSYSRILVRVSLPRGSYIIVKIRCDGGEWREAGKIVGKTEAVVPIRIPINRCDKFELELSGCGECTILDILREYYVGSEV